MKFGKVFIKETEKHISTEELITKFHLYSIYQAKLQAKITFSTV